MSIGPRDFFEGGGLPLAFLRQPQVPRFLRLPSFVFKKGYISLVCLSGLSRQKSQSILRFSSCLFPSKKWRVSSFRSKFHEQDKPIAYATEGFRLRLERGPHRTCGTCDSRGNDHEAGRKRVRLLHCVLYGASDALRTVQQPLRDSFEGSRLRPARSACAKAVRERSLRTRGIVRGTGETPGANREASRSEKGRCAQEARSAVSEGHEKSYATKGI